MLTAWRLFAPVKGQGNNLLLLFGVRPFVFAKVGTLFSVFITKIMLVNMIRK